MKPKFWLKPIPKLLTLLLFYYVFVPQLVLARPYGSDAYSSCRYQEDCLALNDYSGASSIPDKSLFNNYELIIFALLILVSILLLAIFLHAHRRKKPADEDVSLSTPSSDIQA